MPWPLRHLINVPPWLQSACARILPSPHLTEIDVAREAIGWVFEDPSCPSHSSYQKLGSAWRLAGGIFLLAPGDFPFLPEKLTNDPEC